MVGVNDIIQLRLFSILKLVKCLRMSMFILLHPFFRPQANKSLIHPLSPSISQSVSQSVRQSDSQSVSQSVIGLDEGHTLEMLA